MATEQPEKKFSIGIGVLHAVIFFVAAPALFILTATVINAFSGTLVGREEQLGRGAGILTSVGPVVGYAASYAFQKGRKWVAGILTFSLVTLCMAGALLLSMATKMVDQSVAVTEAERHNLQVTQTRLFHPDLGFDLPHPGEGFALVELPEARERLSLYPEAFAWWLMRPRDEQEEIRDIVMIQGSKLPRPTPNEGRFQGFVEKFLQGANVDAAADTIIWESGVREYRLAGRHRSTGAFVLCRCLASDETHKVPLIVCAVTASVDSVDSNDLAFVSEGLVLVADTTDS